MTGIGYNARGQRISIGYGNGTTAAYGYDPQTFRLTSLTTTRPGSFTAAQQTVQALSYFYDPVGNVTAIRDDADTQDVIFFRNQRVEPSASYAYDAVYRLIAATGREHLGQSGGTLLPPNQVTNDDSFHMGLPQPGDGTAMGTYTENYAYDAAGNLQSMGHVVSSGNWTRRYAYAEPSQITAAETGNRLTATSLPGDPTGGPYSATYAHDAHGNMTRMPHLSGLTWDENDRLRSTTPNAGGTPQVTWYAYDASEQRVRKATDQPGTTVLKSERIYLGAIEIYRDVRHRRNPVTGTRDAAYQRRRARDRASREPHERHRQGISGTVPLPALQPPGFRGPRTRRRREHHHLRGVLPVRQHLLPGRRVRRPKPLNGTATRGENATRKMA